METNPSGGKSLGCVEIFFAHLSTRSVGKGCVQLFVPDKFLGLLESVNEFYPRRYCSGTRCIFTSTWERWCRKQSEESAGNAEVDPQVGDAPPLSRRPSR